MGSKEKRCIGCGKPITDGKIYRILTGRLKESDFSQGSVFGDLHEHCFSRAVQSPKTALEELKMLAKSG